MQEFNFTVSEKEIGLPAKEGLRAHFGMSKKLLRRLRWEGLLRINGQDSPLWTPLEPGDQVYAAVDLDTPHPKLHFPADQQPLFQNEDLLILSKKPGQVVHPCLNHELEDLCSLISDDTLHPVNRLDRDTSGLVIIALNGYAHSVLAQSKIEKKYLTVVHGHFTDEQGEIEAPIARSQTSLIERCVSPYGKYAKTRYRVLAYAKKSDLSLVECELLTGRTHQIRVHMAHIGHPIVGDSMYGYKDQEALAESLGASESLIARQALHAASLSFADPRTKKRIHVVDPLPSDIESLIAHCDFTSL
ncbi:MAG: RluA family pseudouridine synthase [Eubacteriales bacterium]|nr:RluA family pseudouridine synthase [Eubacteriales bacterium]